MINPYEELRECIGKLRYAKNRSEEEVVELHDRAINAIDVIAAINQNLPLSICSFIGHRVDSELPPVTLEVLQDGKRIGRIENIGIR
jgi:hypothetical protein